MYCVIKTVCLQVFCWPIFCFALVTLDIISLHGSQSSYARCGQKCGGTFLVYCGKEFNWSAQEVDKHKTY